jgi:hypothetical protein
MSVEPSRALESSTEESSDSSLDDHLSTETKGKCLIALICRNLNHHPELYRSVRLCPLNIDDAQIPPSCEQSFVLIGAIILKNQKVRITYATPYSQINTQLNELLGYTEGTLTVLEENYGPSPFWTFPAKNTIVPRFIKTLYLVDHNKRSPIALLRTENGDQPLVIGKFTLVKTSFNLTWNRADGSHFKRGYGPGCLTNGCAGKRPCI